MFQEIIYDLLLGLRVQTSDIEGDQLELPPFSFDSGEISIDSGSLFVGECVPSTVPVASSIPTRTVIFSFGLLLLWYQSRVDLKPLRSHKQARLMNVAAELNKC